jgi:hypothetical protein
MITKREAAVISAYTGILLGPFDELHKYIEEIMERPVWTHELASKNVWEEIKLKSKPEFLALEIE